MKKLIAILCLAATSVFGASTFNGNHVGTFTGNGSGLTNIPASSNAPGQGIFAGTQPTNYGFNFSVNLDKLPNFQKALGTKKPRIMWFGDSTGADSIPAFQSFLNNNYSGGTEPEIVLAGTSGYFDLPTGCIQSTPIISSDWWGNSFVLTNGITQTFGGQYVNATRLSFWYNAKSTRGTCTVATSTDGASWTTRMTVDTSAGTAGVHVTNVTLTAGSYKVRVTTTVGGSENRVSYLWPELWTPEATSVMMFDGHANGAILGDWIAMGSYSVESIITNFAPDIILWQQTKQVYSMTNWPNVATYFKTFATNCDVVIVQSQNGADPSVSSDPANGGIYQLPIQRGVALTNNWAFVDLYSMLNDWQGFVVSNAFNNDNLIHLNAAGKNYSGLRIISELRLLDYIAMSGVMRAVNPVYNLTNNGMFASFPTNVGNNPGVFLNGVSDQVAGLWLGPSTPSSTTATIAGDTSGTTYLRGGNGIYLYTSSSSGAGSGGLGGNCGAIFSTGGMELWTGIGDPGRFTDPGAGSLRLGGNLRLWGVGGVGGVFFPTNGLSTLRSNQVVAAVASISVGASPFSFTNTFGVNIVTYIAGGTASEIDLNTVALGTGLALSGLSTVELQPGEWVKVTYSVAPNMHWKPF